MQTAQRQGGHPLRMEPRCTVIEFSRFDSCQVRSGLVDLKHRFWWTESRPSFATETPE